MLRIKPVIFASALLAVSALSIARTQDKDIVDTATGKYNTFVKLINDAGLTDTLKAAGPYTVLIPTDDAFDKAMKKNPAWSEKLQADKDALKKVLLYHVLKGAIQSTDLKDGQEIETLEGEKLTVKVDDATKAITIDKETKVTSPDIKASNGVIQEVDGVLVPPTIKKQMMEKTGTSGS